MVRIKASKLLAQGEAPLFGRLSDHGMRKVCGKEETGSNRAIQKELSLAHPVTEISVFGENEQDKTPET